jgi:hypothetical protein
MVLPAPKSKSAFHNQASVEPVLLSGTSAKRKLFLTKAREGFSRVTDISPGETTPGRWGRHTVESQQKNSALPNGRSALVIAHPGHELRVYGWMCRAQPFTFILTDGSGRSAKPRIEPTSRILSETGATAGCLYGRLTDVDAYAAVINHDFGVFISLAEELAATLVDLNIAYVVGDAVEGYNPIHDVCRFTTNAAVAIAEKESSKRIENFDFLLAGDPSAHGEGDPDSIRLNLGHGEFERKLAAAAGYVEMTAEINATFDRFGTDRFRVESLRPVRSMWTETWLSTEQPFYEVFGESRVASGHYKRVIRYREHLQPLAQALARRAGI